MTPRRIGSLIGDLALTIAAAAGAVCIALVVAALAFNVSIMLFATGSMSPSIPAGSAALVREIPVGEVRLGDVVTVDRPGKLPVTHRVVGIADSSTGDADHRALTLRGDANPVDDPAPYDVATVRIVLWSVPGIASVIEWFGDPIVLGSLTVAIAALVMWTFWPREPRRRAPGLSRGTSDRPARHIAGAGAGAAVVLAAASLALPVPSAEAAPVEQVVQGRYLRLTTISDPLRMRTLGPDDSASMLLGVTSAANAPGIVSLALRVEAAVGAPLRLHVVECAPPTGAACTDGRVIIADLPLDGPIDELALGEVGVPEGGWFRFDVHLPAATATADASARLVVRASGSGEIVESPSVDGGSAPSGGLARSGADAAERSLLAGGVLVLGIGLAWAGRPWTRRRGTEGGGH